MNTSANRPAGDGLWFSMGQRLACLGCGSRANHRFQRPRAWSVADATRYPAFFLVASLSLGAIPFTGSCAANDEPVSTSGEPNVDKRR